MIKLLKLIATPFLFLWMLFSWTSVILIAPIALLVELIKSIKRGEWK